MAIVVTPLAPEHHLVSGSIASHHSTERFGDGQRCPPMPGSGTYNITSSFRHDISVEIHAEELPFGRRRDGPSEGHELSHCSYTRLPRGTMPRGLLRCGEDEEAWIA